MYSCNVTIVALLFLCSLYLAEGFLHLENAIGLSIVEFYANKSINLQVSVEVRDGVANSRLYYTWPVNIISIISPLFQQFPYPPYFEDIFFTTLSSNFALLVVMAFIFSAGFFVKVLCMHTTNR